MLIALVVFVLVAALVIGPYWALVAAPEERQARALHKRLETAGSRPSLARLLIKDRAPMSRVEPLDRVLAHGRSRAAADHLQRTIEHAGMNVSVGTVFLLMIFLGLSGGALALGAGTSVLVAAGAGACGAALPLLYLRRKARQRMATFEEEFPEAMDLIARSLRAGHSLPSALQMVGEEIPDPVGAEFRALFERQSFGSSLPDALKDFGARIPTLDAKFFATALLTQRETGGNLSEVLENLASVIRERFKVKRHVRTVSAHGRTTGWILAVLPPAVAGILLLISPTHIRLLVDDPLGTHMVMFAVAMQIIGIFIIRKIVNVEY